MSGLNLKPVDETKYRFDPEMGAGGAIGQPRRVDGKCCQALEEDFAGGVGALKEYGHGRNVTILSKKNVEVQALPAIDSSIRYEDSLTGITWFQRRVLIHTRDQGLSYSVGMRCSPADVPALMPLFDRMLKSFRILGPPS